MPNTMVQLLDSKLTIWFQYEKMARKHITNVKRNKANGSGSGTRPTLFRHLVDSDLPASEMHDDRLCQEAQSILGAGSFPTGAALTFISYQLIANERIRSTLKKELGSVMAEYPKKIPSWSQLEQLPYLCGVIKEGLR
ncbi:hypothetical protein MMC07_008387 [Pseudocyphellaria aurata]|nr:hypothetical protein [Pseudocyphellaria aurata]